MSSNPIWDRLPVEIRGRSRLQACPVCPEKDRAKFCHALPANVWLFFERAQGLKIIRERWRRFTRVRGQSPESWSRRPRYKRRCKFVVIFSLMYYCEVGKQYWKVTSWESIRFMSPEEMVTRNSPQCLLDCGGDKQKVDKVLACLWK